jgi:hypothetical protein
MLRNFILAAICLVGVLSGATDVLPLLEAKCGGCHSAKARTSGFSVQNLDAVLAGGSKHGKAVIGGHPEQSPLIRMVKGELAPRMPMGTALSEVEIAQLEAWVKSLPAESPVAAKSWRWPYERPKKVAFPSIQQAAWVRNPLDRFVLARIEAAGLTPAPVAEPATLARRLYLDLVGVPPTAEELARFEQEPYEKTVDRLLADPRYGERWGRHWLDVARYGETSGLEGDGAIGNAWRYRDWVIDAFNQNMPYNRFVTLQIGGGDEHSKTRNNYQPDPQGYVPTGFLRVAPWDRSNLVAADVRQNYLSEVTSVVGSVFLGLSVGCARCHDHKYDPIPTRDYYRMQAFFQATEAGRDVSVPYKNAAFGEKARLQIADYEKRLKEGPEKKELDAFEKQLLAKLIQARKDRASQTREYTRDDLYLEASLKASDRGIFTQAEVDQLLALQEDAERTGDIEEKRALEAVQSPMLDRLRKAYASGVDPLKRFEGLKLDAVRREAGAKYSGKSIFTAEEKARHGELTAKLDVYRRRLERWKPNVLAVTNVAGPPSGPDIAPTRILLRGDYRQPGEVVEPGFLSAITGHSNAAELETDRYRQFVTRGRRLTLAKWIASEENPQTARVWVNRMWQQHFGAGIVRTTSDFGVNGDRPSHPELLDWLAVEFMESGWDTKAMHKLMVTSSTYRQSAENPGLKGSTTDPDNRLLAKFNRRRLEAEAIRDSILQVSGRLNPEMGGPSVFPPLPADLADFARYGRNGDLMWEPNEKDADALRRSVYIFQRRSLPLPMMSAFDANVFSESCDRRSSTTTPLQALSMMNGYLVEEESAHLARLVEKEAGPKREDQVRRLFERVLGRGPKAQELDRFASFSGKLDAVARVLFNSNEFLYTE